MIISPWIFYLIGIAESIGLCLFMFGLIIVVGGGIGLMIHSSDNKLHKPSIFFISIGCIFLILNSLIPSEKTCYQMLAASLVTKDNIEYVTETGKDIVDYICESAGIILKNEQMVKNHSTGD